MVGIYFTWTYQNQVPAMYSGSRTVWMELDIITVFFNTKIVMELTQADLIGWDAKGKDSER